LSLIAKVEGPLRVRSVRLGAFMTIVGLSLVLPGVCFAADPTPAQAPGGAPSEALPKGTLPGAAPTRPNTAPTSDAPPGAMPPESTPSATPPAEPTEVAPSVAPAPAPGPVAPVAQVAPVAPPPFPSPPELPPPGDPTAHLHDGFYLRLSGGFGFGSDSLKSHLIRSGSMDGFATAGEIMMGGTPGAGVVVGGAIQTATIYSPTSKVNDQSVKGPHQLAVFAFGPFVDWYVNPRRGLHLQAFVGLSALGSDASKGSEDPGGLAFSLGVGYEWWVGDQWSMGILGRFLYSADTWKSSSIDETHSVVVPSALFTATYH